jgi:integrase/recombinase XerD
MAAVKTGAREDELATSTRDHLDRDLRQITLIGKGRKGKKKRRVISLYPFDGFRFFKSLPPYVGPAEAGKARVSPWLFWHDEGQPYASFASTFYRLVKRCARIADKEGLAFAPFCFHHLRHRHAVDFLKHGAATGERGYDIYALQGRLGHSSVKTTEMYLEYLTVEEKRAAMFGQIEAKRAQKRAQSGSEGTAERGC